MTDAAIPADGAAHAAAYRGVRERIVDLVVSAPAGALDAVSPATPQWRVRDVFAHLVGVATDVVNGNVADAAADHWTAAQVEARHDVPLAALVEEWAQTAPGLESLIAGLATVITGQIIADAVTHEHDLRCALGRPGARDSDALTIGVAWVTGAVGRIYDSAGDPAVQFESEALTLTAGTGPVELSVRASTFELARAIAGRRTRSEIAAYDWKPEASPERLLVLPRFTPPAVSLGE